MGSNLRMICSCWHGCMAQVRSPMLLLGLASTFHEGVKTTPPPNAWLVSQMQRDNCDLLKINWFSNHLHFLYQGDKTWGAGMSVGKPPPERVEAGVFFLQDPEPLLGLGRSQANPPRAELICSSSGRQLLRPPTNCLGLTLFYWGGGLYDGLETTIFGKTTKAISGSAATIGTLKIKSAQID